MNPQADLAPRAARARAAYALALAVAAALSGCATTGTDAKSSSDGAHGSQKGAMSLHPPAGGEAFRVVEGPDIATLKPGRLFPGGDMLSRMRFIEAIDVCGRSGDGTIRSDAQALRKVLDENSDETAFFAALAKRFTAWECVPSAQGAKPAAGLVTGYATPVVRAKRHRNSQFRYPLFVDLRRRFPEIAEASRREILSTRGVESQAIAWLSDPLAWALVETNGSARLVFDDGIEPAELLIARVSTNGRPWTGIGRWFAEHGLIDKPNYTLADVRTTAYVHPEKAEMAALDNDRVVYFTICDPKRFPTTSGLPGGRLIAGWSCAADQSVYPAGSILLVVEETGGNDLAHIVFVHDSGGAIAGTQRVDCYLGEGDAALARAGELRGAARVYRLRAVPEE